MKHLFIVNPIAGGRDQSEAITAEVRRIFSGSDADWEVYVTRAPLDAVDQIRQQAARTDTLRVYACGGDGTLNECVSGAALLDNVAVTHYPCGTGNDFVKLFGDEKGLFSDLEALVNGSVHPLDLIRCGDRWSANICSVGVDARIGTEVHKYSHLPLIGGKGGYLVSAAANLFKGINRDFTVRADGELVHSGPTALVCVCNGQYYGGSFHACPDARPDDGRLDVLVIRGVSRLTFARLITKYAAGRYAELPEYAKHLQADCIEIDAGGEDIVVNLDGEALHSTKVRMEMVRSGIRFIAPANMAFFEAGSEETAVI